MFHEAQYWGDERRRLRLRLLLALGLSLLLHGLPSALGLIAGLALRALPKPPIQVEILPPRKKAPPPVVVDPPAPTPPPAPAAPAKPPIPKKPGAKPEARDKSPQVPSTRLTGLGPSAVDEELGLRVLLRMPALRTSPHRGVVETLLAAFPDTHILAAGTPFPPPASLSLARAFIDDIDTLLIATADPRDITATTFYAGLRPGSDLLSKLGKRRQLSWDSRRVRPLRPDLFSFARPDLLGPGSPPPAVPSAPSAPPPPPAPVDERALAAWSDRLAAALAQPGPALYGEVNNPQGRIRLRGDIPTPTAVRLVLSADADPQLVAHIELATAADADRLLQLLPQLKSELSGKLFWLGLGGLLSDLRFAAPTPPKPRRPTVEVRGKLPRADVAVLLLWMKGWLPPPDRFPELVPPPPPAASVAESLDAGVPDSH